MTGLVNLVPLVIRHEQLGRSTESLIAGSSYLLLCAILRFDLGRVQSILANPFNYVEGREEEASDIIKLACELIEPIMRNTLSDLATACARNCRKLIWDGFDTLHNSKGYFYRFMLIDEKPDEEEQKQVGLIVQIAKEECRLGIVDEKGWCPLIYKEGQQLASNEEDITRVLKTIKRVLMGNIGEITTDANHA